MIEASKKVLNGLPALLDVQLQPNCRRGRVRRRGCRGRHLTGGDDCGGRGGEAAPQRFRFGRDFQFGRVRCERCECCDLRIGVVVLSIRLQFALGEALSLDGGQPVLLQRRRRRHPIRRRQGPLVPAQHSDGLSNGAQDAFGWQSSNGSK